MLRRDTNLNALHVKGDCFDNDHERRFFDYFRSVAMPKSAKFFGSDFWGRRVLQISHSEPAVKHAVLALSSLHQQMEGNASSDWDKASGYALRSYNKALGHTSRLLSTTGKDNLEKGLIACALFIYYENMIGGYAFAQMHLQNGLRILQEARGHQLNHTVPKDILQVFSRLDLQAMTFSDSRSPYPFAKSTHRVFEPGPIPSTFSSVNDAMNYLFEHMTWVYLTCELYAIAAESNALNHENAANLVIMKSKSDMYTAKWDNAFGTFLDQLEHQGKLSLDLLYGSVILHIYRSLITLVGDASFFPSELYYDNHHHLFERILTLVESLPEISKAPPDNCHPTIQKSLSLELGIVMPLFHTAAKCRDPFLRRRAIAHLKTLNRREGIWDSFGAARVAETIMSIEEGGLGNVRFAKDIPQENRIMGLDVTVHAEKRQIDMVYRLRPNLDGPLTKRGEIINF